MNITIFDVEQGACNLINFPSGETMLIDCGHNSSDNWRPSLWLKAQGINLTNLTISNMDEDHVSDLPNIYRYCKPASLTKNPYMSSAWIKSIKTLLGLGNGVSKACDMIDEYTGPPLDTAWGGVLVKNFFHSTIDFKDVNSLSVVTFIIDGDMGIVFPGDLTSQAWRQFLKNPEFCALLEKVRIFVASHHGRSDGYEPEVFKICHPDVIIISDKNRLHATQEVDYSPHAYGITWNSTEIRKVLTTRKDGSLNIQKRNTGYFINSGVNVAINYEIANFL